MQTASASALRGHPETPRQTAADKADLNSRGGKLLVGATFVALFFQNIASLWDRVEAKRGAYALGDTSLALPFQLTSAVLAILCVVAALWAGKLKKESGLLLVGFIWLLLGTSHFEFDQISARNYFYFALVLACLMLQLSPTHKVVRALAWTFALGNIAAVIFRPTWALSVFYDPSSMGHHLTVLNIPIRLVGLESQPNNLGYVAGCFIIFTLGEKVRGWNWVLIPTLLLLLLFSQSKTALVALVLAFAIVRVLKWRPKAWFPLVVLGISASYFLIAESSLFRGASTDVTLTGRTEVWSHLADAVSSDPIFGLGPKGISQALSTASELSVAANTNNAHNIVWQVLTQGGIFSLCALAFMIVIMWRIARRNDVLFLLMTFTIIRACTEAHYPTEPDWIYVMPFLFYEAPIRVAVKKHATGLRDRWRHMRQGPHGPTIPLTSAAE